MTLMYFESTDSIGRRVESPTDRVVRYIGE